MLPEHIIDRKIAERRGALVGHNRVFQFSYQRRDYFAKFYRGEEGFQRETYALENFSRADIPVPEIVFKSSSYGEAAERLVVTERLKGTMLDQVKQNRNKYCHEIGRLLSLIHAIRIPPFIEPLVIPTREIAGDIIRLAAAMNIEHPLLACVEQTLEELNASTDKVLLHGDYIGRHIFVFNEEVTGIIDWECLRVARREIDLAHCCAFLDIFGQPNEVEKFIEGYGQPFDERLNNNFRLYYKIIFAHYWKRLEKEHEHQRALHAIRTHAV